MFKKDVLISILQIESARARGEKVSEVTSARVHAEHYLADIIEALDSGVPYARSISFLSIEARCTRQTAYDVLRRVLRKAGYIRPEEVPQRAEPKPIELIAPVIEKKLVDPVIQITENPKPIKETKPVPVPSAVKISDSAKYIEKTGVVQEGEVPDKWDYLKGSMVIGNKRFMGEEHRWASPEVLQKEKDDLALIRKIAEEDDERKKKREKAKVLKELQETQIQSDKE